jgi:hypothetical protein
MIKLYELEQYELEIAALKKPKKTKNVKEKSITRNKRHEKLDSIKKIKDALVKSIKKIKHSISEKEIEKIVRNESRNTKLEFSLSPKK